MKPPVNIKKRKIRWTFLLECRLSNSHICPNSQITYILFPIIIKLSGIGLTCYHLWPGLVLQSYRIRSKNVNVHIEILYSRIMTSAAVPNYPKNKKKNYLWEKLAHNVLDIGNGHRKGLRFSLKEKSLWGKPCICAYYKFLSNWFGNLWEKSETKICY